MKETLRPLNYVLKEVSQCDVNLKGSGFARAITIMYWIDYRTYLSNTYWVLTFLFNPVGFQNLHRWKCCIIKIFMILLFCTIWSGEVTESNNFLYGGSCHVLLLTKYLSILQLQQQVGLYILNNFSSL